MNRFLLKICLLTLIIAIYSVFLPVVHADSCYLMPPGNTCIGSFNPPPPGAVIISTTFTCAYLGVGDPELCAGSGCCCHETGQGIIGTFFDPPGIGRAYCQFALDGEYNSSIINEAQCIAHCANNPLVDFFSISGFVKSTIGIPQTGADVHITGGSINQWDLNTPSGYYLFENLPEGFYYTLKANRSNCESLPYTIPLELYSDLDINLTLSECCNYNCPDWSTIPCSNGVNKTRTCTATPSGCGPSYQETISCAIPACDWQCGAWDGLCQDGFENRICTKIPTEWPTVPPTCEGTPVMPIFIRPCQPPTEPECGNGILEDGEQCDLRVNPYLYVGECSVSKCTQSTCQCDFSIPPDCEADPPGIGIETFGIADVPRQRAFDISWTVGEDTRLDECADYVERFTIRRCQASPGNTECYPAMMTINMNIDKDDRSYRQENGTPSYALIQANTYYCYNLTMQYNTSVDIGQRFKTMFDCEDAGDDLCLYPEPPGWCINNEPTVCDGENELYVNPPCSEGTCVYNPISGEPECSVLNPCEKCNSILSMFGPRGYTVYNDNPPPLSFLCPKISPNLRYSTAGCYLDYSDTTADMTYNCANVTSCYDYKSKVACEFPSPPPFLDICKKFSTTNKCVWESYSNDMKLGICRPPNEELQDCPKCEQNEFNRIYPDCTRDVCYLYGNCYYKESSGIEGDCLNAGDIICSDYVNRDECVGIPQTPVWVNTTYNSGGTRIGGDNALLRESNDTVGIGRCRWVGPVASGSCIKDADNKDYYPPEVHDCTITNPDLKKVCERDVTPPTSIYTPHYVYGLRMDLSGMAAEDNRPEWPLLDKFSTEEINPTTRKGTWIYHCVNISGMGLNAYGTCYPNNVTNTRHETNKFTVLLPNTEPEGEYLFRYFAEDPAKNLEVIKEFPFFLDKTPPEIDLELDIFTYQPTDSYYIIDPTVNPPEYYWVTDLSVRITLIHDMAVPVNCTFTLEEAPGPDPIPANQYPLEQYDIPSLIVPDGILDADGDFVQTGYPSLSSGRYIYEITCVDNVGNKYNFTEALNLDGDLTIDGPTPFIVPGPNKSVELPLLMSINTSANITSPGACRYSHNTTNYTLMTKNFPDTTYVAADNTYIHTAPLDAVIAYDEEGNEYYATGIYRYYVACSLIINGQPKIVIGSSADSIDFAVDEDPPETILYDGTTSLPYIYNTSDIRPYLILDLGCDDKNTSLMDRRLNEFGEEINVSRWFGCDDPELITVSHYCLKQDISGPCLPLGNPYTPYDPVVRIEFTADINFKNTYGNRPYLCYYSVDKGGNIASERCTRLGIQNMVFDPPQINITG